jgi:hypothetical protein
VPSTPTPTKTIGELITSWLPSEIVMAGTVIVSLPLPAGHSPADEPEAVSVLAAAIASRSEHTPSSATVSALVKTGIIVACTDEMGPITLSAPSTRVRIAANDPLHLSDWVFSIFCPKNVGFLKRPFPSKLK